MDLIDSYDNIRLHPNSEKYSTFSCSEGLFNIRYMQQGYKNAPATIMRAMSYLLRKFKGKNIIVYLDDILIGADIFEELVQVIREVCQILQDNGFYLNREKCQFMSERLHILGHIITNEGIVMDLTKIESINNFPVPNTKKKLQQFIGMVNYLSPFCYKLAEELSPLTSIQGFIQQHKWSHLQQQA